MKRVFIVIMIALIMNACGAERVAPPAMDVLPSDITNVIITSPSLETALKNIHMLALTNKQWRNYVQSLAGTKDLITLLSKNYQHNPLLIALVLNTKSSLDLIRQNEWVLNEKQIVQTFFQLFALNNGNVMYDKALNSFIQLYNFSPVITKLIRQIRDESLTPSNKSLIETFELLLRSSRIGQVPQEIIDGVIEQPDGKYVLLIHTFFKGIQTFYLKRFNKDLSIDKTFGSKGVITINQPLQFRDHE